MSNQPLRVTPAALAKLRTVKVGGRSAEECAVRIRAFEAGAAFRYEFSFEQLDAKGESDADLDVDGLHFFIDDQSLPRLAGATLDFVDDLAASGFRVDNPNRTSLASNPLAERIQKVLDEEINPGVGQHGGHVSLVTIEDDKVVVQFGGGCQGCGQADATLKQGVAVALKRAVPEIQHVVDATDHAAGSNPYY